jgi:hypothetical protein
MTKHYDCKRGVNAMCLIVQSVVVLRFTRLSVFMLSVIILSVVMPCVINYYALLC